MTKRSTAALPLAALLAACVARAPDPATPAAPPSTAPVVARNAEGAAEPGPALADPPPAPRAPSELPRGGRTIFPAHRLVGFCGTPGAPALGKLYGDLPARAKTLASYVEKYGRGRQVLPVFELIAVIVQGTPGSDAKWRRRVPREVVDDYLRAARDAKALLLLNIQPGHSDFLTELKELEPYLREPDVGVALDPEWAMLPKQRPGKFYGQTTGAAIDEVSEYLARIVAEGDLPEKALVYHQVNGYVVKDESALVKRPGVVLVKSVDGLGPKAAKVNTYNHLVKRLNPAVHAGFKLFFDEDRSNGGKLMTPAEVLALRPVPEYVMYE